MIPEAIKFAEWLRVNFRNSPEEFDNYWADIHYLIHPTRQNAFTTEQLHKIYLKRVEARTEDITRLGQ